MPPDWSGTRTGRCGHFGLPNAVATTHHDELLQDIDIPTCTSRPKHRPICCAGGAAILKRRCLMTKRRIGYRWWYGIRPFWKKQRINLRRGFLSQQIYHHYEKIYWTTGLHETPCHSGDERCQNGSKNMARSDINKIHLSIMGDLFRLQAWDLG